MCKMCQSDTSGFLSPARPPDSCGSSDLASPAADSPASPRSPACSAASDGSDAGFAEGSPSPPDVTAWQRRRRHSDGDGDGDGDDAAPTRRRRVRSGGWLDAASKRTSHVHGRLAGLLGRQVKLVSTHALRAVRRRLQLQRRPAEDRTGGHVTTKPDSCDGCEATETDMAAAPWHRRRAGGEAATRLPGSLCRAPSEGSVDSGRASEPDTPGESPEPIEPAVLRFPARGVPAAGGSRPCCRWSDCGTRVSSATQLLEHLQTQHVAVQRARAGAGRSFRCLWQGCKVFDRPGSAAWLERHVLTHGGSRPFRCIVDGCSQRFASQSVLERHVNGHFSAAATGRRPDSSSRRSHRRALQQQHPYSARIFDFCDAAVMERVRYQLARADSALSCVAPLNSRQLQLSAQVIARRTSADSQKPELLVRWSPPDILEDSWVPAHAFRPVCHVPLSQLPSAAAAGQRLASAVGRPSASHRRKRPPT